MAFIPVPNGIKLALEALQNDIPVVNVMYVTSVSAPVLTDLEDAAQVLMDFWEANILPNLHVSYVVQRIVATDVSEENGQQAIVTPTGDGAGELTGDAMAANAAMVISWRTANTGRSFRGRTYIGGFSAGSILTAQTFETAFAAGFANGFGDLLDLFQTAGYTLVVVSKFLNGAARIVALATEIINVIVDNKIDSQRRRTAN